MWEYVLIGMVGVHDKKVRWTILGRFDAWNVSNLLLSEFFRRVDK